jgi:two-component system, NtrC family, nitrogen regulation sensor histidine kinase NtrY
LIRKIVISISLVLAVTLFVIANRSNCDNETDKSTQKAEWTESTNVFLTDLIREGLEISDSLSGQVTPKLSMSSWAYFKRNELTIVDWTSNEWHPDSSAFGKANPFLHEHQTGWELVIPMPNNAILTYRLTRNESGQFQEENHITPLQGQQFELQQNETDYALLNKSAYLSFYGRSLEQGGAGKTYLWGMAILLMASLLSFRFWFWGSGLAAIAALLTRILSINGTIGNGLEKLDAFDPMIFATSSLLPSIGDLGLHILTALMLSLTVIHLIGYTKIKKPIWIYTTFTLTSVFGFFSVDLIRSLLRSLIANSNISFDVTHLSTITIYTMLSATMVSLLFWIWYAITSTSYKKIKLPRSSYSYLVVSLVIALIFFVIFQHLDANRSMLGLLPSVIFTITASFFLFYATFRNKRKIGIYKYIIYILMFSFFYTASVQLFQENKEAEYLNLYASKLISNKDLQAEYLFKEMENKLAQQFLVPEDFKAFSQKKEQFEQRLRRLYFSGYLDKYNMLVLSFDSAGNNINSSTLYNYNDLDDIYNFKSFQTLSNHFYQVKSDRIFNGYLAKFENCDLNGHYGSVFILLEPKFIQSSYEYPQLISRKKDSRLFDIDDYSYALYSNGTLLNQKGTYPYNLHYDSSHFRSNRSLLSSSAFNHFISHQEQAIVVLSHPGNQLKRTISTFSFAFIFFIVCFTVFGILWVLIMFAQQQIIKQWAPSNVFKEFKFKRQQQLNKLGIEQVYLSTRIRLAMVLLVFAGLLVSIYVTIQFIQVNDQNRSENELMYKIREVANQLQNEVDFSKKLENPESRQLIVNEIGDIYKIDANLFDSSGHLLASSIEDIYQKGLIAPLMNPEAIQVFKEKNTSQLLHSETIRNLKFTSAYLPLVNDKRLVVAYLNLPYYSRQKELNSEISSYTVTFVNLYLFLILVAITLAYIVSQRISKPLQIIREKMSQTGLSANELIEWKRNDEIGRLVKQYNKMVLQLGESATKLSASEREGAWKEMARQVAHEIKNPLTPMKLNIQHLQRAWSDKNERLEETFKRVTAVLIEQIDSLSKLATEFSSFAQMPQQNVENCSLTQSLVNTITLFEKSENVTFQYADNLPDITVHADKEQLGRIFNNVIKNAIQSVSPDRKGLIKVSMESTSSSVTVSIEDNGKGIDKGDAKNIFVPNFSTKNSGMGLGLAITRKMIESADGRIWFESTVGVGTNFFLEWPVV